VSDPQPSIGFATIDDVPELARLRWELYAEQDGEPPEPFDAYAARFSRSARTALASEDWRAWVARADGKLVGAMWVRTVTRVPVPGKRAGPIGYLTNVYVAPEYRDAGLGGRMRDRVTAWCRDEGYSLVIVWPTERSRPFYRRGGFDRPDEPLVLNLEPDGPLQGSPGGRA
jgi:GNAT superfamily N-acetyltransferase